MKKTKIDIMGKTWTIKEYEHSGRALIDENIDGYTSDSARVICIYANKDVSDPVINRARTLRHEIIHAYLFECGLGHNLEHIGSGHSETMVD